MNGILFGIGLVAAGLAGAIHVYIFALESLLWSRPSTWRVFGLKSQADAETTRPLAYNQGFYNLFLALGVFAGLLILAADLSAGVALILGATVSMVLAALVLVTSSPKLARSAAIQGALPLIAVVLIGLSFLG